MCLKQNLALQNDSICDVENDKCDSTLGLKCDWDSQTCK